MISVPRFIGLIAGISASLFLFGAIAAVIGFRGSMMGVPLFLVIALVFYGLALYGFLHYRAVRQEELRDVLAVAADSKSPLAIAVWAYVEDRPRSPLRRFVEGAFTNFLILGFYWSWHQQRRFDRRAADLASHLEAGVPLSQALCMTPGTASRETILAAAVGESTGDLATPLKQIAQSRIGSIVIEIVPRLLYPLFLLGMQLVIVTFLMVFVIPKFEKILSDFKIRLPESAAMIWSFGKTVTTYLGPFVGVVGFGLLWLIPMLIVSPTFRWWLPGVSIIERRFVQGRLLKMFGVLLGAGKTAPEALKILRGEDYLGPPAHRRLELVRERVKQGAPLAEELAANGLMPKRMIAFLHTAERARNFPWALQAAGDTMVRNATRLMQRVSAVVGPLAVAIMGVFVALMALGVFIPFITILTGLTPR
jgi:type II secretory pathway component PulF